MKNGTPIIDADGHIMESEADLIQKLPPGARERRCLFPLDTWQRYLEGHPMEKRRADRETRLADMKSEGIDVSVLYPTLGLNHIAIQETGWAVDLARAYNEYLSDFCARSHGTLSYVALLPIQDMKAALEELKSGRHEAQRRRGHAAMQRTPQGPGEHGVLAPL
jgi:predicted TIM-barrel fold metal-dependent hydrolase